MSEKRIADVLDIETRFLRSAHLERDFRDAAAALKGYVLTDFTRSSLGRIAEGLKPRSGHRAWRITGHYGAGKSSFAVLLAHFLAGRESNLPPQIRSVTHFGKKRPQFLAVLVTCARQPLSISILNSLQRAASDTYGHRARRGLAGEISRLADSKSQPTDDQILELVTRFNTQLIVDSKAKGLVLILDELGKALEYAALHPERQDIFLLQRLAETASRSAEEPLFIISLLHQGFSAYADQLDQSTEREWEKIAGRFEEIVFEQPIEEIAELIASALQVSLRKIPQDRSDEIMDAADQLADLGWFGATPLKNAPALAVQLFPLHPSVLPVLIRTFRRFGQNERSLFSFLLSNEPFGLQAFAEKPLKDGGLFRLHDLYDYVRANFGYRLAVQTYRSHWNLISSMIDSFATEDELEKRLLKTVGILNLHDDDDLPVTDKLVLCAVAGSDRMSRGAVKSALQRLRTGKRVLWDRGARGLCLWPHTSVNLDKAYDDAKQKTSTASQRVAPFVKEFLETRPIVARRHYIQTGNLRHWDVRYCSVAELARALDEDSSNADGVILVPLCETPEEHEAAKKCAKYASLKEREAWLLAVPQPLSNLASLVQEARRWDWVSTHVLELNADKYAREEVARQKDAARLQLAHRIQSFVSFKQFKTETSLCWFHKGKKQAIANGRQLLEKLSEIFDQIYPDAPRIQNELVNRRSLSSAAAAARMRLMERMFENADKPWLGMDPNKKPPEMSIYLSVLKNSGIHQPAGDSWRIGTPDQTLDKPCRVIPSLAFIQEIVEREPDKRVNVATLFNDLRRPPHGVRDGLMPLLLAAFAIEHEKDVAFYNDGTFLREMKGEAMLLLTKAPERFDIQLCKIQGVRAELFSKLVALLQIDRSKDREVELLDVVRRLCVFVAELPPYVRNTSKLSPTTLSVRDAILNAHEPATLLFSDLPKACGFKPITAKRTDGKGATKFIESLRTALDELRMAYPQLEERLRKQLRVAFNLPGSFQCFRKNLATRAEQILLSITEPKLRAFCLRLIDENLPESDWLESLGSYLALKPPSKWHDAEEDGFNTALSEASSRFHRVESVVFSKGRRKNDSAIRLAVTRASGMEHEEVVHFSADEEARLRKLERQFEGLLAGDHRLALAAASRAIWNSFEKNGKKSDG
ncbi:MAG TPA: hypothetical protein VJU77_01130 [Chthoniobacterales bacterium]|nr:hypothetical protein [Chthoniobacterales bacterium]